MGNKKIFGLTVVVILVIGLGTLNATGDFASSNNSKSQISGVNYNSSYCYCFDNNQIIKFNLTNQNSPIPLNYDGYTQPLMNVNFRCDVMEGSSPLTVHFKDLSSSSTPISWFWDFGDGTNSTLQNPTHTYYVKDRNFLESTGFFRVTLTISNGTNTMKSFPELILVTKMDSIHPTVTASLKSGLYNTTKTVQLRMSEMGTIYYTLNGTKPTNNSPRAYLPITISKTTILKYFAVDLVGNPSKTYTNIYKIDKIKPHVTSTTPKNNTQSVSLKTPITIKFNENIFEGTNYSMIHIINTHKKKIVSTNKSIKGNQLTITITKNKLSANYYQVYIPKNAVQDNAGNKNNAYVLKFKSK